MVITQFLKTTSRGIFWSTTQIERACGMTRWLWLLWLPIYNIKSRQNASQSIVTLKSNGIEDDTRGKTNTRNLENGKRSPMTNAATQLTGRIQSLCISRPTRSDTPQCRALYWTLLKEKVEATRIIELSFMAKKGILFSCYSAKIKMHWDCLIVFQPKTILSLIFS